MGIVFRQSIKTSIVILIGAVIGLAFTYWQTKVMIKTEIGISKNLIYQAVVLQSLVLFGFSSVLLLYIHRFPANDQRRSVIFTSSLFVPLLFTILFSIPYFLMKDWFISKYQLIDQPYLHRFYAWMPVLTFLWAYLELLSAYLISFMRTALAVFMKEVLLRIINILLLALFAFGKIEFSTFIIGTIFAYCLPIAVLALVARRETRFKLSLKWSIFSKKELKDLFHYAWYHMLIVTTLTMVLFIDQLMLAPLSNDGSSVLAVYSIAVLLVSFVSIPYKAMLNAALPKINEAFIENKKEHLASLFNRTNLNIIVATVFVGVLIMVNIHNAVALLPAGYEAMAPLFMILFLGRLIDVSTGLNQEFISITPHYKFTFYAALVYIFIAFVGNRIFIPRFGIYGAAWVAAFSLMVYNIIKAIYLRKTYGLYPFEKRGLWIFPIIAITYGISWLIPHFANPFVDTLIRTPIIAVVMIILLLWLQPSEDVKDYWQSVRQKKRLF